MLTPIANTHKSRLPKPGAIVRVIGLECKGYSPKRRWIVESYPLSDAADQRYSRGIHTVRLKSLDGQSTTKISGFYCDEQD